MAGKTNRKHGRCKRSPAMAAYKAESRDLKSAKRRAKRQEKLRDTLDATKARRVYLREKGALARIERRVAAAGNSAEHERLVAIRAKVAAALKAVSP